MHSSSQNARAPRAETAGHCHAGRSISPRWEPGRDSTARLAATEASDSCHFGIIIAAQKEMSFVSEIKETVKV